MTTVLYAEDGSIEYAREGQSCKLRGTLVDDDGTAILLASLATFTLTLFDKQTRTIINSRSAVNIKNNACGTVASDGSYVIRLNALDNVIVSDTRQQKTREVHTARLTWTWNDGVEVQYGGEELDFEVEVWASVS